MKVPHQCRHQFGQTGRVRRGPALHRQIAEVLLWREIHKISPCDALGRFCPAEWLRRSRLRFTSQQTLRRSGGEALAATGWSSCPTLAGALATPGIRSSGDRQTLEENASSRIFPRLDAQIRHIVFTTNATESVNARIRRTAKARRTLPQKAGLPATYPVPLPHRQPSTAGSPQHVSSPQPSQSHLTLDSPPGRKPHEFLINMAAFVLAY
ncbi:transposase [Streptomyces sp. TRM75561]|uniref:transposase n=1 Tax=Streptomyces sp. TRM75561 TaxID=2975269 RepID=UPI00244BD6AE|nr:transposase [Streptomyces sp. TRM75561]MDH3039223.1 transposase [Streptomyces sp. TRM75561]